MPLLKRLVLAFCLLWLPLAQAIEVVSIAEHARDGGSALAVVFSSALDPKQKYDGFIELARTDGQAVDGAWVLDENQRSLYFPKVDPKTQYQITVRTGLPGADGSLLVDAKTQSITTRNIEAALSFGSSGSLLPVRLERSLPVISVNVNEVDIDFHRVSQDKLEQMMQMARDNSFKNFWSYREFKQLATPVYSGRFSLDPEPNKRREFRIPLNSIEPLRKPGLYLAVVRAAANYNTDLSDAMLFTMSDISLHLRHYGDRLDVYPNSIATGKGLVGVKVRLLSAQGKVLKSEKSTADGPLSFTGLSSKAQEAARFVLATQGDNLSILDLERPAFDLADFNIGQRPYRPTELFVYGPRDLYRPGESVILSGLLRDADGHATQAVPLKARWRNPAGEVMREFVWQPEAGGYYGLNYQLPAGAMTGKWQLQVDLPGSVPLEHPIRVEEFMPERMKLDFEPEADATDPAAPLKVTVLGEYLYGAPAAGNSLETRVEVRPFREPLENWAGFEFGDIKETEKLPSFTLDETKLDDQGQALLDIPSQWQKNRSPLDVWLNASLFETGGRAVNRSFSNLIWPADANLIGIKPLFGKENPQENSRVDFDVILADVDGQLAGNRMLEVQLISEDRQYFWEYSEDQGWHYEYSNAEYPVEGAKLTSSDQGPVRLQLPVKFGHYRLEVSEPESGYRTSLRFHAGRDWYYWWQKAQVDKGEAARPDQVALSLDKPQYHLGETAKLTIVPPADGEALILLEGDKPLWSQRIEVKKSGTKVKIPVPADAARQDLYVTAVVFEPASPDQGTAPRRTFGLAHLKLDHESRRLTLSIEAPEKARPNQTLPIKVKLGNLKPNSQTRVTLSAVDEGVLAITRFKTPDPFEGFFGPRRYSGEPRDLYDQIIQTGKGMLAKLRFGGDGGDEDEGLYGTPPKSKVEIFSLFSGSVAVNAQGEAQIALNLPDFNGKARLMALAFDDDSYGSAEKSMTLAAPLVAEASLPRFMAYGDESRLAIDLHNLSGQSQLIRPRLTANGPVAIKPFAESEEIKLADGEKRTLFFQARAEAMDAEVPIQLELGGLKETDGRPMEIKRHWTLGLRPAWPAESRRQDLVLRPGTKWQPDARLFDGLIAQALKLQLSLGTSPQLDYQTHLTELLGYPYGCLEQTSSATLPLALATPEVQKQLGLKTDLDEQQRLERVNKGMERILSMQQYHGGFGFWSKDEEQEQHWLSAYATDVLLDLQRMNIQVPKERLELSLNRLGGYLRTTGLLGEGRYSQDAKAYSFAAKAYAGFVLARVKQAQLTNLRQLYDQNAADAKTPLSLIQLGVALQLMGDNQRGEAAIAKGLGLRRDPNVYIGDYGSPISDLGHAIRLLSANGLAADQVPALAFELSKLLKNRIYLSTQERNALFLAGLALSLNSENPWQASLADALGTTALNAKGNWSRVLPAAALEKGLHLTSKAQQNLYLSAISRGYSANAPAPQGGSLKIERHYHDKEGGPLDLASLTEGQFVIGALTIRSDTNRADLLVEELLPAGLELENPNLADAVTLDGVTVEGQTLAQWREQKVAKHQEYRDDRFVAALELNGGSSAKLYYVARAVTPGLYRLPPPMVEDMYDPETRAVGENPVAEILIRPR